MDFGEGGTIPRTPLIAVAPWLKELIVSHIIECPACSTRYRMNKPIPEGGRSVKCARCGHQWRLVPENTEEEAEILAIEEQSQAGEAEQRDPFDRAADYVRQARGGVIGAEAASEAGHEPDVERQATDWLARRDHHAAAISTLSQPELAGYEQPSAPDVAESHAESEADAQAEAETDIGANSHTEDEPEAPQAPAAESWWQRFRANAKSEPQPEAETEVEAEAAEEDDSGRFNAIDFDFGDERPAEPDDPDEQADEQHFADEPAAAPPPFGAHAKSGSEPSWPEFNATAWRETSPPAPDVAEPDFEEAEAEIREALRSALENPAEPEAPAFPKADAHDTGGEADWRSRWNLGSADKTDEAPPQTERFSFATRFDADAEEDEPSPFRLTGKTAKFPVFGARDQADEEEEADPHSPDFENDIEDGFRPGAAPKRAGMAEASAFDEREPASDFGSVFDERFARTGEDDEFLGDDFDDEAALQQRLESTDLAEYNQTRSYGGLAIAAAWAVFFSIISGIALAFVSFRQDIMASLPGTRSLYHTLGFAVADNTVDFSDVSYRWTTVEGKPMIEVTGQVVNVTERTVKVPRVLVNVRDGASRGPVKATANVQADLLAPKESANFSLEFVSPSKDISQIELEFDENR